MQRSSPNLNWLRGGLKPGSKHQKHMTMLPTQFLYRFPNNPNNPGPNVMKYYWTLGRFPTGLVAPFRLYEFLNEYQARHTTEEVDEWLRMHITDPIEALDEATRAFMLSIEKLPNVVAGAGYKVQLPMVNTAIPKLEALQKEIGVEVPVVCLRGIAGNKALKARVLDDLYDYNSSVRDNGSTPHRRAMRKVLERASLERGSTMEELFLPNLSMMAQLPQQGGSSNEATTTAAGEEKKASETHATSSSNADSDTTNAGNNDALAPLNPTHAGIASALHIEPQYTAPDERALIRLLTTFGEGAMKAKKYDAAATVLESALLFANDDVSRSTVHNNLATACNRAGEYKLAEHNAREAVLLDQSNKRAFRNLGVALAYQQREDEALSVLADALELHKQDNNNASDADTEALKATQAQILSYASAKPVSTSPAAASVGAASSRYNSPTSRARALENGFGNNFGNEFDAVAFNGKKINAVLDPTQYTHWFKRAAVVGLSYRSSTKTVERN